VRKDKGSEYRAELERELLIGIELFGDRAEVAQFQAKLIGGRAGHGVVGPASVPAERLKLSEVFFNGLADECTRAENQPIGFCVGSVSVSGRVYLAAFLSDMGFGMNRR